MSDIMSYITLLSSLVNDISIDADGETYVFAADSPCERICANCSDIKTFNITLRGHPEIIPIHFQKPCAYYGR